MLKSGKPDFSCASAYILRGSLRSHLRMRINVKQVAALSGAESGNAMRPKATQSNVRTTCRISDAQYRKILSNDQEPPLVARPMAFKHECRDGAQHQERYAHMANHTADQISFYDESLKKQIEGSYRTDGRSVHVRSIKYGIKSAPYGDRGTFPDQVGLDLLAQKLLTELARDPDKEFKDLQKQKGDQQVQPRESFSCAGMRG